MTGPIQNHLKAISHVQIKLSEVDADLWLNNDTTETAISFS